MKNLPMVLAGAALLTVTTLDVAQAATFRIPVREDESVYLRLGDPNYNLNGFSYRGGLFSGVDGGLTASSARFYLKFNLPSYVAGTSVTKATLRGYYNDDYNEADDDTHGIYFVASDLWSESTLTWDNQPGQAYGIPEARFQAARATEGTFVHWDITSIVNQEYLGDGVLSLLFHADNEGLSSTNQNWEYFAEKEFDSAKAFRLKVDISPMPQPPAVARLSSWEHSSVPEPETTAGILSLGVLGAIFGLNSRLRNKDKSV